MSFYFFKPLTLVDYSNLVDTYLLNWMTTKSFNSTSALVFLNDSNNTIDCSDRKFTDKRYSPTFLDWHFCTTFVTNIFQFYFLQRERLKSYPCSSVTPWILFVCDIFGINKIMHQTAPVLQSILYTWEVPSHI